MTICNELSGSPAAPQQDPEYMEQQSPTGDAKHLQEDTERAISKAAAEHDEKSPEALLNTVRNTHTYTCMMNLVVGVNTRWRANLCVHEET